jgi:microsomal dipeptidase-like Zn-dependent dipeptidase
MRRLWLALAGLAIVCVFALLWLGRNLESFINRVEPVSLPEVTPAALRLHRASLVVDLHADSLLFGRDLLEEAEVGHVDFPRLRRGGVGLQVFDAVTRVPMGQSLEDNDGDSVDMIRVARLAQLSPAAFLSPLGRALRQAEQMRAFVERSEGDVLLIRSQRDLSVLLAARERGAAVIGALLGIEGAHALDGDPANLDRVFDAGYRMIGLTHFFDNAFAGSAHGTRRHGLTDAGRELVRRMEVRGVVLDLAHLSPTGVDEVLAMATRPPVFSHGGVRSTCDNARNLSDDQARAIAAAGGVIGIGYFEWAICGRSVDHVVAAIRYAVELVGDRHVALGSDFDGATTPGFDTSELPALTQALLDQGLSEPAIRGILGGNAKRVLMANLSP